MVCYMRNRCVHRRLCEVLGLWGSLSGRLAVLVLCQQAELLPFQHEAGIAGVKENMSHHTQKPKDFIPEFCNRLRPNDSAESDLALGQ